MVFRRRQTHCGCGGAPAVPVNSLATASAGAWSDGSLAKNKAARHKWLPGRGRLRVPLASPGYRWLQHVAKQVRCCSPRGRPPDIFDARGGARRWCCWRFARGVCAAAACVARLRVSPAQPSLLLICCRRHRLHRLASLPALPSSRSYSLNSQRRDIISTIARA